MIRVMESSHNFKDSFIFNNKIKFVLYIIPMG